MADWCRCERGIRSEKKKTTPPLKYKAESTARQNTTRGRTRSPRRLGCLIPRSCFVFTFYGTCTRYLTES